MWNLLYLPFIWQTVRFFNCKRLKISPHVKTLVEFAKFDTMALFHINVYRLQPDRTMSYIFLSHLYNNIKQLRKNDLYFKLGKSLSCRYYLSQGISPLLHNQINTTTIFINIIKRDKLWHMWEQLMIFYLIYWSLFW